MSKVAVIVNCYNAFPIFKQCLDALFEESSPDVFVVLIDQHSPDQLTREYLHGLDIGRTESSNWIVLDPGKNLGTHNGWNFGFDHAVKGTIITNHRWSIAHTGFDYVVKLDDDTVITTKHWDRFMVAGLEARQDIAFLSADGTPGAKQFDNWVIEKVAIERWSKISGDVLFDHILEYEIPPRQIVDFHCVMFRVAEMNKWGPLTNPEGDGDKRLYGGEELYMANKVRKEGRKIAYFKNVFCNHLDAKDRVPGYQLWKFIYGITRTTDKPFDEWMKNEKPAESNNPPKTFILDSCRNLLGLWCHGLEGWGSQHMTDAVYWIGELGVSRDIEVLDYIGNYQTQPGFREKRHPASGPQNMPEVFKALEKAHKRLVERHQEVK